MTSYTWRGNLGKYPEHGRPNNNVPGYIRGTWLLLEHLAKYKEEHINFSRFPQALDNCFLNTSCHFSLVRKLLVGRPRTHPQWLQGRQEKDSSRILDRIVKFPAQLLENWWGCYIFTSHLRVMLMKMSPPRSLNSPRLNRTIGSSIRPQCSHWMIWAWRIGVHSPSSLLGLESGF